LKSLEYSFMKSYWYHNMKQFTYGYFISLRYVQMKSKHIYNYICLKKMWCSYPQLTNFSRLALVEVQSFSMLDLFLGSVVQGSVFRSLCSKLGLIRGLVFRGWFVRGTVFRGWVVLKFSHSKFMNFYYYSIFVNEFSVIWLLSSTLLLNYWKFDSVTLLDFVQVFCCCYLKV
jgi:hypothetical protein